MREETPHVVDDSPVAWYIPTFGILTHEENLRLWPNDVVVENEDAEPAAVAALRRIGPGEYVSVEGSDGKFVLGIYGSSQVVRTVGET